MADRLDLLIAEHLGFEVGSEGELGQLVSLVCQLLGDWQMSELIDGLKLGVESEWGEQIIHLPVDKDGHSFIFRLANEEGDRDRGFRLGQVHLLGSWLRIDYDEPPLLAISRNEKGLAITRPQDNGLIPVSGEPLSLVEAREFVRSEITRRFHFDELEPALRSWLERLEREKRELEARHDAEALQAALPTIARLLGIDLGDFTISEAPPASANCLLRHGAHGHDDIVLRVRVERSEPHFFVVDFGHGERPVVGIVAAEQKRAFFSRRSGDRWYLTAGYRSSGQVGEHEARERYLRRAQEIWQSQLDHQSELGKKPELTSADVAAEQSAAATAGPESVDLRR